MFHRVRVIKEEQCSQRFLWRNMNTSIEPDHYEMQVLIFGATSSPCSVINVKNENAMQHELVNHELAPTIVNDFYVDNCLTGADSEEKCMDLRRELSEVNVAGGSTFARVKSLNKKSVIPQRNVLGMWWDPMKDIFGFKFGLNKVPPEILEGAVLTKRQACSLVMSVYDPLCLVNHFKIKGIINLQRTWIAGIGCDEELAPDIYAAWKLWLNLLSRSIIRKVEVPTFVDASQEAFSAVTYLRVETRNGNITTTLFGSKTRVAPLTKLTIPKLELQGCVLGTRFAVLLRSELQLPKVARVGEIQEATKGTDWRWVPTSENPADIATRFETEISFKPTNNSLKDQKRIQKTARFWYKKTFHKSGELNPPWKAAMENNKVRQLSFTASPEEYREIAKLAKGRIVKKAKIERLSQCLINGTICLEGRILQANKVPAEQKTPAILPSDYRVTELLIQAEHERCAHQGADFLGFHSDSRNGPTPTLQTCAYQHPFTFTGLDAFGTFTVTVRRRHEKRWVIIFTCLVTRAIHLEVVHILGTDEFMMGLSRFIDTRGRPDTIYSDNGTNFVGASKELKLAANEIVFEMMAASGKFGPVKWKFNPPAAPHFGEAWERLIKSVKKCLRATLNEVNQKDATLLTALKSAENIINSRPLTYVSSDPTEDYISKLMTRSKWHHQTEQIRTGDLVFLVDELHPRNMWKRGFVSDLHFGPDGQVRVATITAKQNGKAVIYKRPVTKIFPSWIKNGTWRKERQIHEAQLHKLGAGM
ncbi:hypothetical protein LAZ67_14003454 [Cordylochernes scorpioides]|uniref:Integrase catalytic domain-containing protein n=1 Tax=Cordylochernes scorpioides TaxID=51811 RepID=A0ABY6L9L2_9ARAC|nr:hypothetical protein LAZ67_14003454 [Cordylochernes scorpioides]